MICARFLPLVALAASAFGLSVVVPRDDNTTSTTDPAAKTYVYPNCAELTFTASASVKGYTFPRNANILDLLSGLLHGVVYTLGAAVAGEQNIVARYCEPEVKNKNNATLEVLLHSITNNMNLWSGLGPPGQGFQGDAYSWIAYASKRGFPTLSLDRLGNGKSSHPDPILVVQGPYEYALYHAIIQQIKSGKGSPLPRSYQDIALVGNSYGSVVIDNIAVNFPNAANSIILTGYSHDADSSLVGISAVGPAPAAIALPAEYGTLPVGYLTTTSDTGRTGAFYGPEGVVDYPVNITLLDIAKRDVVSVGQFLSNYIDGSNVAHSFTGRALVLTGEEDNAFCGPGNPSLGPAKCGQRLPQTGLLFPNSDYNWYSVAKTGHSLMFHDSRMESFKVAHDFLEGAKFAVTG